MSVAFDWTYGQPIWAWLNNQTVILPCHVNLSPILFFLEHPSPCLPPPCALHLSCFLHGVPTTTPHLLALQPHTPCTAAPACPLPHNSPHHPHLPWPHHPHPLAACHVPMPHCFTCPTCGSTYPTTTMPPPLHGSSFAPTCLHTPLPCPPYLTLLPIPPQHHPTTTTPIHTSSPTTFSLFCFSFLS